VQPIAGKARLLASRAVWSGDWLHAVPLTSVGLRLDNASASVAVALRLGSAAVHSHNCVCGAFVQPYGHHGLSCLKSAGRHVRHAAINDIIHRALNSAGIHAILEPVGLCGTTGLRPDRVTLLPWSRGTSMVWDYNLRDGGSGGGGGRTVQGHQVCTTGIPI